MKSKAIVVTIGEMLACYKFEEDQTCQYDPSNIISRRRKKPRRGKYEQKVGLYMMKLANRLTYLSGEEESPMDSENLQVEEV